MPSHLFDGQKGDWVWIEPKDPKSKMHIRAATVTKITDDQVEVAFQCGDPGPEEKPPETTLAIRDETPMKVQRMAPNCIEGVDNMTELGDLHEGSLLHNLRLRFRRDVIYTYVGQILVCVNPYTDLGYTTVEWMKKFKGQGMDNKELLPHPFGVADHVYGQLLRAFEGRSEGKKNQSVVISGESGAGKTVTTGHVLEYLVHVTGKESEVAQQILSSGEMLETFGNAKTMRNNNSSRFGKFIEVLFDEEGQIVGAEVNHYLLEKSRVTMQSHLERNYHSFYHLFVGWPADYRKERWFLSEHPEDYRYLAQSGVTLDPNIDDKKDNQATRAAMETLRFSPAMQETIWDIVAAVLHIGNIRFDPRPGDASAIANPEEVAAVSTLLKLPQKQLERALLVRMLELPGGKTVESFFIPSLAIDNAGALAKALYSGMFDWIMHQINVVMKGVGAEAAAGWIGVLDIFGFEHFTNKIRPIGATRPEALIHNNHFEQFCINFANEKLQNFFNLNIFEQEKAIYRAENIPLDDVRFQNNDMCIELIQGKGGILDILNEISKPKPPRDWTHFRKELLDTFCTKPNWTPNPEIDVDMRTEPGQYVDKITAVSKWKTHEYDFVLWHYAGPVHYTAGSFDEDACADFVTKNKDKLSPDLRELVEHSDNQMVAHLFEYAVGKEVKTPTVGKIFSESLNDLIARLASTNAIFVRTIKPNSVKRKRVFEDELVLEQLRCAGMLETIKIRKMGYPRKLVPEDFVKEYALLVTMDELKGMDPAGQATFILERFCVQTAAQEALNGRLYRMGTTKVFFKDRAYNMLEKEKDKRLREIQKLKDKAALLLRCVYRTWKLVQQIPAFEAAFRNRQKWIEEKIRRMRETGKSSEEVEAEMIEEQRKEEENRYVALVESVVGAARKEIAFALEHFDDTKHGIRELLDDSGDPPLTDDQKARLTTRVHELEGLEMAANDAVSALEHEYSVQRPGLEGYNVGLAKAAMEAIKQLKTSIAYNLDTTLKEKSARFTLKQKEIMRKERAAEAEAQAKRDEEARKAREKALEEERIRIRKIEQEEALRRAALEEKQRQMAAELDRRFQKRHAEKLDREHKIEERRAAFRLKRKEMLKQETLARETREFELMQSQQEQDFVERCALEDAELESKRKAAEIGLKRAQTSALEGLKVMYGDKRALVRYVGPLPFYAAGQWVGLEFSEPMGSAAGHNGMVRGEQMFQVREGHGLFVRGEWLHILEDEEVKHGSLVNWNGYLARVRYVGPVHFEAGTWVGIELDEEVGKNNGTVLGHEYFRCRAKRGVITRAMNVAPVRQWTKAYVDNATQTYITKMDLDLFLDNDYTDEGAEAERELLALETQEAEQRLRDKYGPMFRMADFDADRMRDDA